MIGSTFHSGATGILPTQTFAMNFKTQKKNGIKKFYRFGIDTYPPGILR